MIEVMATLFALLAIGYLCGKKGYLGGELARKLSRLVLNTTCPALIMSSAMTGNLPERDYIFPLLLISVITYTILIGIGFLLPRFLTKKKSDEGILGFTMIFGNVGFMGYPVVASLFGYEAVFYAAVLNVVNTLGVFTVGTMLLTGGGEIERERFQKKVLYSTPMLASYLTMVIVALNIKNVPAYISHPLVTLGNFTIPAALLIIGSSISNISIKKMLGNGVVYLTSLIRLFLLPVLVFYVTKSLGFSEFVVKINTVVIAMPVATYGTILCLKYGRDTTLITEATFITTLLSMASIPMLVLLFF